MLTPGVLLTRGAVIKGKTGGSQTSPSESLQQLEQRIQSAVLAKMPVAMEQDDVPERLLTLGKPISSFVAEESVSGKGNLWIFPPRTPSSLLSYSNRSSNRASPSTARWKPIHKMCRRCLKRRCSKLEICFRRGRGMTPPWSDDAGRGSSAGL